MSDSNKPKLSFKNLDLDIERCCIDTGESILGTLVLRGYDQARDYVFGAYLEKQLYHAVVEYLLTCYNWEWGTNEYLEHAKDESGSITQQIELLTASLEKFAAKGIKRFQSILDDKVNAAYLWDLWALAYIAQGGCPDDGYADLRGWLILLGRKIYELALEDVRTVVERVPQGIGTRAEGLQSVAFVAYERRTVNFLPPGKSVEGNLGGVQWEPEELPARYPEVC